jgi:hypothetical protein
VAVLPPCRIVERSKGQPRCDARCNVGRQGALRLRAGTKRSDSWAVVEYAPAAGPTVVSRRHRGVEDSCGLAELRAQVAATPASAPDPGDRSQDSTNAVWSPARGRPVGSSISEPLAARRRCFRQPAVVTCDGSGSAGTLAVDPSGPTGDGAVPRGDAGGGTWRPPRA